MDDDRIDQKAGDNSTQIGKVLGNLNIYNTVPTILVIAILLIAIVQVLGYDLRTIFQATKQVSATLPQVTQTPNSSFDYQVRVQAKDTGEYLEDAKVTIELGGKAPLENITDTNGFARILISRFYAQQPGVLIIEASGYERYWQNIDLIESGLPRVIQLNPLVSKPIVNEGVETPTATSSDNTHVNFQNSNSTQIELEPACLYYTSCDGSLKVTNTGSVSAKNVSLVIILSSVEESWTPIIDDIEQFRLRKFPPTLNIDVENIQADLLYDREVVADNNGVKFTASNLPPSGEFRILLTFEYPVPTKTYEITRTAKIYIPRIETQMYFNDPMQRFLEEQYHLANFTAVATCDNCEGPEKYFWFPVATIKGWGTHTEELVELEEGYEWNVILRVDYDMPEQVTHVPETRPLYIRVSEDEDSGQVSITETNSNWFATQR